MSALICMSSYVRSADSQMCVWRSFLYVINLHKTFGYVLSGLGWRHGPGVGVPFSCVKAVLCSSACLCSAFGLSLID